MLYPIHKNPNMPETGSGKLMRFLVAIGICLLVVVVQVQAQSLVIRPDRLMEGDGKTRNITLEANNVAPGATLNISVSYSSDPNSPPTSFIPKFSVQDNSAEDKNTQDGKIRLVLPKAFDKTGVYLVEIDEPRTTLRLVHEPNSSYIRRFVDWLVGAAGSGTRGGLPRKPARERIEEVIQNKTQDKFAIWIAPMPPVGQEIQEDSRTLKIRSALMPSWSRSGNQIACSVWKNGKWNIAVYTINRTGGATPLWQWNPRVDRTSDFSPAWSPNGDAIAFVRLTQDQKSDLWILQLKNRRPQKEIKVTNTGNVQTVFGWDKDAGLIYETRRPVEGRKVWATKTGTDQLTPLSDGYSRVRGSAPLRQTLIYAWESDSPPYSALYEMDSTGKGWPILIGRGLCLYQWPTISRDEKWLAFDFDCPR